MGKITEYSKYLIIYKHVLQHILKSRSVKFTKRLIQDWAWAKTYAMLLSSGPIIIQFVTYVLHDGKDQRSFSVSMDRSLHIKYKRNGCQVKFHIVQFSCSCYTRHFGYHTRNNSLVYSTCKVNWTHMSLGINQKVMKWQHRSKVNISLIYNLRRAIPR